MKMHFEYKDIEKYGHKSQYLGDMFNTMYIRLQIMAQFFFDGDIKNAAMLIHSVLHINYWLRCDP